MKFPFTFEISVGDDDAWGAVEIDGRATIDVIDGAIDLIEIEQLRRTERGIEAAWHEVSPTHYLHAPMLAFAKSHLAVEIETEVAANRANAARNAMVDAYVNSLKERAA